MSTELLAFQQRCAARGWTTHLGDGDQYLYMPGTVTSEVALAFTAELAQTDLPKVWASHLEPTCTDLDAMLPVYTVFITHLGWSQDLPQWLRAKALEMGKYPHVTHLGCPNASYLLNSKDLGRLRDTFPNLKKLIVNGASDLPRKSTVEDLRAIFQGVKIIA